MLKLEILIYLSLIIIIYKHILKQILLDIVFNTPTLLQLFREIKIIESNNYFINNIL